MKFTPVLRNRLAAAMWGVAFGAALSALVLRACPWFQPMESSRASSKEAIHSRHRFPQPVVSKHSSHHVTQPRDGKN